MSKPQAVRPSLVSQCRRPDLLRISMDRPPADDGSARLNIPVDAKVEWIFALKSGVGFDYAEYGKIDPYGRSQGGAAAAEIPPSVTPHARKSGHGAISRPSTAMVSRWRGFVFTLGCSRKRAGAARSTSRAASGMRPRARRCCGLRLVAADQRRHHLLAGDRRLCIPPRAGESRREQGR